MGRREIALYTYTQTMLQPVRRVYYHNPNAPVDIA